MVECTLWHNPRCSKSRQTLELLRERGVEPQIRLYLEDPPSGEELADVLGKLGMDAGQLLRAADADAAELDEVRSQGESALIAWMADNPRLIQRPVAIVGDRAALGRPPENVLELLRSIG